MKDMQRKILVIDDEQAVLESCRRIFEAEGFQVRTTADPAEGLNLAACEPCQAILVDWQMPSLNGMDVLSELEKLAPESALIMFSGYPSIGCATEAMKRGAMDYVSKPFTPDEIVQTVNRAVKRRAVEEKKTVGRFESALKSWKFPVPSLEDKAPRIIAETVAHSVGVSKVESPWVSLFVLGVLAGAYIGFGGLLASTVSLDASSKLGLGPSRFLSGAAFSMGLMLVVIAGAELFTGNNLMITSIMSRAVTWQKVVARWAVVYAANFAGSILIVLLFYFSGLWKTGGGLLGQSVVNVASAKVSLSFSEAFVRGVGCNWLVCLAVWMALASHQVIGKIGAIFFPIMGFVAIGFEHCVANMYFIPAGILLNQWAGVPMPDGMDASLLGWGGFFWNNLLPVTVGNTVGGVFFVGLSYWGAYLRPAKAEAR
jgi:formate/nitrite transporter